LNFYKLPDRGVQRGSLDNAHFELIYQFVCGIFDQKDSDRADGSGQKAASGEPGSIDPEAGETQLLGS
jgi:hypothetical protein